jgi:hypothetical protein
MSDTETTSQDTKLRLKLYTLYLKDLQTIGTRHEHARKYYLTLISTIFTILSLGGNTMPFEVTPRLVWLVAIFGAVLCGLWLALVRSYSTLFHAKFNVLREMETALPCQPFTREDVEKTKVKHRPMLRFDMAVAGIFIVLFLVLPFLTRAAHQ